VCWFWKEGIRFIPSGMSKMWNVCFSERGKEIMEQDERNDVAIKVAKLLYKQKPKPNIIDCLDILNNLSEQYIKELDNNFKDDALSESSEVKKK
jgi:hypothetical protein